MEVIDEDDPEELDLMLFPKTARLYNAGLSIAEIAKAIGVDEESIRFRLSFIKKGSEYDESRSEKIDGRMD